MLVLYGRVWIGDMGLATIPQGQISLPDYIRAGQAFAATSGKQTSGGSVKTGLAIFNGPSCTKNIYVYSAKFGNAAASQHQLFLLTADPGLSGITVTPFNLNPASSIASQATLEAQNTAVTYSGNLIDAIFNAANNESEFLTNGAGILLPAGSSTGIGVEVNTSTNAWNVNLKWIEF